MQNETISSSENNVGNSNGTLPVVWCADRNSVNNKPTAFALQGIQLQGNISEQHVLAVRELINAASEGRLLLPADGGVVVLSCGAGVGSLIVSSSNNNNNNNNSISKNGDENQMTTTIGFRDVTNNFMSGCSDKPRTKQRNNLSHEIYEFLCCARCMTEGTKCHSRTTQNSKIIEKYLDAKINAGRAMRRASNSHHNKTQIKHRRRATKNSFKNDKRSVRRLQSNNNSCIIKINNNKSALPIYATVNKREKIKNRENVENCINIGKNNNNNKNKNNKNKCSNDAIETNEINQYPSVLHESFRKTSFDSTCTISSMDSGFMEMQSKIEALRVQQTNENVQIKIDSSFTSPLHESITEEPVCVNNANFTPEINHISSTNTTVITASTISLSPPPPTNAWNRLTIPQQSRNRRKSYEEFKSLFCDHNNNNSSSSSSNDSKNVTLNVSESSKSLSKSRRKSYEEFKSATNLMCDENVSKGNEVVGGNRSNNLKTVDENTNSFFSRMRRGSKRFSQKGKNINLIKINHEKQQQQHDSTIYDILRKTSVVENKNLIEANTNKRNYDKNLELFENHCNENQNSLKSCGTIYDIIQKRSDMYSRSYKKYDKYMTYGTLYEILLHRKNDEGEQFDRKRTFSEKYTAKQRVNYDFNKKLSSTTPQPPQILIENGSIHELNGKVANNINSNRVSDTNEDNLNSSNTSANCSLKQGSCNANNQLSITSVNGKQLSTIYDILQTKKLETNTNNNSNNNNEMQPNKNRFLVRKITEEELVEFQKESSDHVDANFCNKNTNNANNVVNDARVTIIVEDTSKNDNSLNDNKLVLVGKKQTKLRRFSNILSYSPKMLNEFDVKQTLEMPTTIGAVEIENKVDIKIDEIYSRLNRIICHNNKNNNNNTQTINEQSENLHHHHQHRNVKTQNDFLTVGSIYKSNSLDMLSTAEESQEFSIKLKPQRKISVPAHLPPKILPKKNTRRLSEFTRGEFLNEKL
jgi:hypothetical protein